ncbi:MAG: aminotransferase class I/II-fold pyridoxal phosphate-dependent enzyme, partial [Candidatus Methanomethylicia archaeon]
MKRNYLSPPPPPPAIRTAMAKVAEREVRKLPVFDFSSGNVGRLPAEFNLFTKLEIEVNRNLPESLAVIAEGLRKGIIESFYQSPKGLGYSTTGGTPQIKKLVLEYFRNIHGIPLSENDLNRVIVTAGGQQALAASLRSLKEGIDVLMPRWEYDAASGTTRTHGLREVRVDVKEDLSIDLSDVESKA